jgi:hypothetical protein
LGSIKEKEQQQANRNGGLVSGVSQAAVMRACWERGRFWHFLAVHSSKGMLRVSNEHVQRQFCEEHCTQRVFDRAVFPYWVVGAEEFILKKLEDEERYKDRVRERFGRYDLKCDP